MHIIFKGATDHSLNSLRQKQLIQKVTTAKYFVKLGTLHPTKSALRYRSCEAYFEILLQKEGRNLHATEQCWAVKANKYVPVLTDLQKLQLNIFSKKLDVYVNSIAQLPHAAAKNICPGLMFLVLVCEENEETLNLLVNFQMIRKSSFIVN